MTTDLIPASADNGKRLPMLDDPEVSQALSHLRSAAEKLRDELLPLYDNARLLPAAAELLEIEDQDTFDFAQVWCREEVLSLDSKIRALLDPYCKFGDTVHKAFTGLRKQALGFTETARGTVDRRSLAYNEQQERLRREAERRAALERERLENQAKCQAVWVTIGWLASAVAEAEIKKAELAKIAETAEQTGDTEAAEAIREEMQTAPVVPPLVEPEIILPPMAAPAADSSNATPRRIRRPGYGRDALSRS